MLQLVSPNLNVEGIIGECLSYGRRVFNAPAGTNTAWEAWGKTQFKHFSPPPADVAVPCWFEYPVGSPAPGHEVNSVPGLGFYSSPYSTSTSARYQQGTNTRAVLPSIAEVERIYHCKYVGWSEDINGVRVAQEVDMTASQAKPDENIIKLLFQQVLFKEATDFDVEYALRAWGTLEEMVRSMAGSQERLDVNKQYDAGATTAASEYAPYGGQQLFIKKG